MKDIIEETLDNLSSEQTQIILESSIDVDFKVDSIVAKRIKERTYYKLGLIQKKKNRKHFWKILICASVCVVIGLAIVIRNPIDKMLGVYDGNNSPIQHHQSSNDLKNNKYLISECWGCLDKSEIEKVIITECTTGKARIVYDTDSIIGKLNNINICSLKKEKSHKSIEFILEIYGGDEATHKLSFSRGNNKELNIIIGNYKNFLGNEYYYVYTAETDVDLFFQYLNNYIN